LIWGLGLNKVTFGGNYQLNCYAISVFVSAYFMTQKNIFDLFLIFFPKPLWDSKKDITFVSG